MLGGLVKLKTMIKLPLLLYTVYLVTELGKIGHYLSALIITLMFALTGQTLDNTETCEIVLRTLGYQLVHMTDMFPS
jgi:hypothetical protein